MSRDIYHAKYYGKGRKEWPAGEKNNKELGEKMKKGQRKKGENYIKKGEKGLKKCNFLGYSLKKNSPELREI